MSNSPVFSLKNFSYAELLTAAGLSRLDEYFLHALQAHNDTLYQQLLAYRLQDLALTPSEISEFLIACAAFLETFIAELFNIEEPVAISQTRILTHNPIAAFKKYYVLRRAKKELHKTAQLPSFNELEIWLREQLKTAPLTTSDRELAIALLGMSYLEKPDRFAPEIEKLVQWCTQALATPIGQQAVTGWTSFYLPERLDYFNLVPTYSLKEDKHQRKTAPIEKWRQRDGFDLTDPRMSEREVQDQVNYCIYCHDHDGDFCAKGFPVKKGDPTRGFKKNPLDLTLTGCPLEEKISEMHVLRRDGLNIAALAMIMVDNPMCPATGHRICNECMKACIYQKQEPVNIPQIETRVLTDVLDLPWGTEIYDLFTRWNPLRQQQWVMKPYNGLKVLIAGMGPAGFTLAHHLLLEGFAVVGFDGLKIEPLPAHLINAPVYRFADLKESLDERLMAGFGGVAEYGITVRWDKNFLKLIYLSLMRRPHFQVFGSVRFGGTITVEDAWALGFDHLAVAVGAGLPKALPIPGSMAPGMRQANDFLMVLQLGNAAKESSLTTLQIRLPAVVIGGGLTGVDTATELQAYYIVQVEKILRRYERLIKAYGKESIHQQLDPASQEILAEYLRHGEAIRKERLRAKTQREQPDFIKLLHEWGGVTIAYRRSMQESPAYINNHEELQKALQEGVFYLEGLEPAAVDLNEYGHVEALICHQRVRDQTNTWVTTTEQVRLPARSILVATGTQPNTAYEFEHRKTFNRLNLQYQHYEEEDGQLNVAHGVLHCKDPQFGPFTSYQKEDKRVSLIGDTHPVFHGSVVKAIASGMRTYPKIVSLLQNKMHTDVNTDAYHNFAQRMKSLFSARIVEITRKTKQLLELTIEAPLAAKHFKAGQFYRLQNYETNSASVDQTLLQMEPLPLVAADCDQASGRLTFIVNENSTTAKLCATLKTHDDISLMGPTGVRAKVPNGHETILIIGDQSSFPFLRSYGLTLRTAGNRVLYHGFFVNEQEVYSLSKLEKAADVILWNTQKAPAIPSQRPNDCSIVQADPMLALQQYQKHQPAISLTDVDRIYVVGNTDLLRRFQHASHTYLKEYLVKQPKVYGSVYGNMQCMLKGVCAQCLQWQIDPETGLRTKAVFACSWQDQPLHLIDIDHIDARQTQNYLLDRFNQLWLDYLFERHDVDRI